MNQIGKTALVTGASSGIGEGLARKFASQGYNVILVARREKVLAELSRGLEGDFAVNCHVFTADLSKKGAAAKLYDQTVDAGLDVDILVNNAGMFQRDDFICMSEESLSAIIDLNVTGLTQMLAQFIPPMVERGFGKVLNVSSMSAFLPMPGLATYAASKAYVLSLTESLVEELKNTGVSVSALCPGITATPMLERENERDSKPVTLPDMLISDVGRVIEEGYRACMQGTPVAVPGHLNRFTALAVRAAPKWLVRRAGGQVNRVVNRSA